MNASSINVYKLLFWKCCQGGVMSRQNKYLLSMQGVLVSTIFLELGRLRVRLRSRLTAVTLTNQWTYPADDVFFLLSLWGGEGN